MRGEADEKQEEVARLLDARRPRAGFCSVKYDLEILDVELLFSLMSAISCFGPSSIASGRRGGSLSLLAQGGRTNARRLTPALKKGLPESSHSRVAETGRSLQFAACLSAIAAATLNGAPDDCVVHRCCGRPLSAESARTS